MHLDVDKKDGATTVRPMVERLDIDVAAEFRATLLSLIDGGEHHLIIDLGEVTFIDSSGIGALVSALKAIKRTSGSGDVRLAHVQPLVVTLLETIRLTRVFSTYPTAEDALRSFR
jgi:anti-sigma B factor antagonist